MLRIASILLAIIGVSSLNACGDDTVKPGEILVKWTNGPTAPTCKDRSVATVEATAYKGETEVTSNSTACADNATNGAISLTDLAPGSYRVDVEAKNAAGKGTYLGSLAKVNVSEGKTTTTTEVVLAPKPATITVGWTLPGGGRCSQAGINEIEVYLFYDAKTLTTQIGDPKKVLCDSPDFDLTSLVPNPDVQLVAYGYDSAKKKVAQAKTESFALTAGDELDVTLALEACPGDPPTCP